MEPTKFKPGNSLSFKTVEAIRSNLYQALLAEISDTFCVDLTEVTHCDSAGLALLIEARKLCNQKQKNLEVFGISPEIAALAEFCGVKGILEESSLQSLSRGNDVLLRSTAPGNVIEKLGSVDISLV